MGVIMIIRRLLLLIYIYKLKIKISLLKKNNVNIFKKNLKNKENWFFMYYYVNKKILKDIIISKYINFYLSYIKIIIKITKYDIKMLRNVINYLLKIKIIFELERK